MRLRSRLDRLAKAVTPETREQPVTLRVVMGDEPPDWAEQLIREKTETIRAEDKAVMIVESMVEDDGRVYALLGGQHYFVTPDGMAPVDGWPTT